MIQKTLQSHIDIIKQMSNLTPDIRKIVDAILRSLGKGGKVIWMGNGGSAADSQHLAAEFVGRFVLERRGLPSIALTTDTSIMTAVGNDYGFDNVFYRQIEALCGPNDVVVGITTSGNSENIIHAIKLSNEIGAFTIGFTGESGGKIGDLARVCLKVSSSVTARIQEAHILVGHIICDIVETEWVKRNQ